MGGNLVNTFRTAPIADPDDPGQGRHPQGCASRPELFQHPLVEEPPTSSAPQSVRREYSVLVNEARAVCAACPLRRDCLYDAVVKHDVAGFVAGTTEMERRMIRRQLDVTVEAEDLDTMAGVFRSGRRIDHDEVVRLRQANPHESLEMLARRLDCSLSTVKRHLRRHRRGQDLKPKQTVPTRGEVLQAASTPRHAGIGAA
nr:WhiB family transcriptional regulator [Naumannella cuiyingiana]